MRHTLCHLLSALALVVSASAGDAVLDLVQMKEKGAANRWIISETAEEIKWRNSLDAGTEATTKRREVRSITYAFQRVSSAWTQGMEARERGKFAESAELFGQLATGSREAEQVVGSYEAGGSWELSGNFAEAATAFAKVVGTFPAHPIALDARYRLGMVLAQGKETPKAEELAKKLEEDAKGRLGQQANVRAAAIRAALALVKGDNAELRRQISRASFSAETERPAWLHFNLFMADALRATKQGKDAVQIYERMLPQLADDPANAARVHLGIGLGRVDTDRQGAIVELLTLDALPYGSPEQKCEARSQAGRLLWAEAQNLQKDPAAATDERKAVFIKETIAAARLLLQAAADSTSTHPSKAEAAEALKSLPPDPFAVKEEKKELPAADTAPAAKPK